ncbi:CinA family nicotinamide mononucleotide deamidase-related protein [Salinispira pacifica]
MSESYGEKRGRTACIISAGTEITEGKIGDTHGRYIASALRLLSVRLLRIVAIPDDRALFEQEVRAASSNCDIVFITGGLGPTSDDLTREVVAAVAGTELVYHGEVWEAIGNRLGSRVSESNRRQAYAPAGFELLPNSNGTAPGFFGSVGESTVFALPGPPRELRPMLDTQVLPLLQRQYRVEPVDELACTAFLTPESQLEELLQRHARPGISWGTRVDDLRIAFFIRGGSAENRLAMFRGVQAERGGSCIREGETGAAELLFAALRDRGLKLCTAESCTGGLIAKLMTDIPGSSEVVWGGWVVYSNEAKQSQLSVGSGTLTRYGAVSGETVREMADGARRTSGADVAVSVSGIAGPEGGSDEKPVGTVWIGVSVAAGGGHEERFQFRGDRDRVRRMSAVAALLLAEQAVITGE